MKTNLHTRRALILLFAGTLWLFGTSFSAHAQTEPIRVLSANQQVRLLDGVTASDVYLISAFAPIQFEVTGPGKLSVGVIKHYAPNDRTNAGKAGYVLHL